MSRLLNGFFIKVNSVRRMSYGYEMRIFKDCSDSKQVSSQIKMNTRKKQASKRLSAKI